MKTSIRSRHRFHPEVIKLTIWLYFRFKSRFPSVKELVIEGGVDASHKPKRRWFDRFGPTYAKQTKSRSGRSSPVWYLDDVSKKLIGRIVYLWRAFDNEGNVLKGVVLRICNTKSATRLLCEHLRNQGVKPTRIVNSQMVPWRRLELPLPFGN